MRKIAAIICGLLCIFMAQGAPPYLPVDCNFERKANETQFDIVSSALSTPIIRAYLWQGTNAWYAQGHSAYLKFGKTDSDLAMITVTGTVVGAHVDFPIATNDFNYPLKNWYCAVLVTSNSQSYSFARGSITLLRSPEISGSRLPLSTSALNGSSYGTFTGNFTNWPFGLKSGDLSQFIGLGGTSGQVWQTLGNGFGQWGNAGSVSTQGLASIVYVEDRVATSTQGVARAEVTNGFATIEYVDNSTQGLVRATITNGLATIILVTNALGVATQTVFGAITAKVSQSSFDTSTGALAAADLGLLKIDGSRYATNELMVYGTNVMHAELNGNPTFATDATGWLRGGETLFDTDHMIFPTTGSKVGTLTWSNAPRNNIGSTYRLSLNGDCATPGAATFSLTWGGNTRSFAVGTFFTNEMDIYCGTTNALVITGTADSQQINLRGVSVKHLYKGALAAAEVYASNVYAGVVTAHKATVGTLTGGAGSFTQLLVNGASVDTNEPGWIANSNRIAYINAGNIFGPVQSMSGGVQVARSIATYSITTQAQYQITGVGLIPDINGTLLTNTTPVLGSNAFISIGSSGLDDTNSVYVYFGGAAWYANKPPTGVGNSIWQGPDLVGNYAALMNSTGTVAMAVAADLLITNVSTNMVYLPLPVPTNAAVNGYGFTATVTGGQTNLAYAPVVTFAQLTSVSGALEQAAYAADALQGSAATNYAATLVGSLAGELLYGATNAHPTLVGALSFWRGVTPGSWSQTNTVAVNGETNVIVNRFLTNSPTILQAGAYEQTVFLQASVGNLGYYVPWLCLATNGTTNFLSSGDFLYPDTVKRGVPTTMRLSTNVNVPSGWMLGVVGSFVRTLAGASQTITVFGGTNQATHLATPSLQVSPQATVAYVDAQDVTMTNALNVQLRAAMVANPLGANLNANDFGVSNLTFTMFRGWGVTNVWTGYTNVSGTGYQYEAFTTAGVWRTNWSALW